MEIIQKGNFGMQTLVQMDFGGTVFPNLTLYTQNISFRYQTLVAGQTYNVAIRATNNGAQRLNSTASSDGVEVSPSPQGPPRRTSVLLMATVPRDNPASRYSAWHC